MVCTLAVVLAACARTLPGDPAAGSLYRDLERMVTVSVTEGWDIDRTELEMLLSTALMSACQVPPEQRRELAAWLDARIVAAGGPVDEAWRARGKQIRNVETLLELTRIRGLLAAAEVAAADCPFWLEPRASFPGRQITDDRWILSFEGGGKGIASRRGDSRIEVTGGGAGRVLIGRTFGSRLGAHTGLELGGSADFPRDAMGNRGALVFAADVVVPLLFRWHLLNSYFEIETGYLLHLTETDTDAVSGVRVGLAFGGRALRRRWLIPGVAFAISYERTFPAADEDPLHLVKLGLRVTIDLAD